jgi:predicted lipoprotein with Yx(FWY)xxD motif
MKRFLMVIVPALLMLATIGAFAQDDADTTVMVSEDPVLGPILTDAEGMTLYIFTNDTTENESTCYDDCAVNWPPFNPEGDLTLPDDIPGELTRIERTDGTEMVAYNGMPLYYWINDQNPGDTTGQGVGDVWFVVAPGQMFGDPATPEA